MCSRYAPGSVENIREVYRVSRGFEPEAKLEFKPLIYPGYQAPVIRDDGRGRLLESRFWGFIVRIPSKKDPAVLLEKIMQNAVSETVDEKRTFKSAWTKSRRCVIPAEYFMEPKDKKFVPIKNPKAPLLSIAGIWDEVTYKGESRVAYTMLTCEPNRFMEPIHDRMPVILRPEEVDEWLSPDTPADQAKKLCRPYSDSLVIAGGD